MSVNKKPTGGGVALWSGRFAKVWSKTTGILPLRSGESELTTVVRAPTEGMGLQSTLSDFSLRGPVGNQVGCNCCGWDGPSFGSVKVIGETSSLQNVRAGASERCTSNVPWARTIVASHESTQLTRWQNGFQQWQPRTRGILRENPLAPWIAQCLFLVWVVLSKMEKRNLGMKKNTRDLWESCDNPEFTPDDDVT